MLSPEAERAAFQHDDERVNANRTAQSAGHLLQRQPGPHVRVADQSQVSTRFANKCRRGPGEPAKMLLLSENLSECVENVDRCVAVEVAHVRSHIAGTIPVRIRIVYAVHVFGQ